jgi:hypothetical protein
VADLTLQTQAGNVAARCAHAKNGCSGSAVPTLFLRLQVVQREPQTANIAGSVGTFRTSSIPGDGMAVLSQA